MAFSINSLSSSASGPSPASFIHPPSSSQQPNSISSKLSSGSVAAPPSSNTTSTSTTTSSSSSSSNLTPSSASSSTSSSRSALKNITHSNTNANTGINGFGFNSPSTLDPLITSLCARFEVAGQSAAQDPLQFCADFFHGRLAEERLVNSEDFPAYKRSSSDGVQSLYNRLPEEEIRGNYQSSSTSRYPASRSIKQPDSYTNKLKQHQQLQPITTSSYSSSSSRRDVYEPSTPPSASSYESLNGSVKSRGPSIIREEDEDEYLLNGNHRQQPQTIQPAIRDYSSSAKSLAVKPPVVKSIRFALPPMTSEESTNSSSSPFGNFGGFGAALGGSGTGSGAAAGVPQHVMGTQSPLPNNYNLNRRTSVSAESLTPTNASSDNWIPPFHPKTQDQLSRLQQAVSSNFLFAHLADEQSTQVLGALQERSIPKEGIKVISQGDQGDYFYVVEKGNFDIFVNPSGKLENGADGLGNKVTTVGPGGSFGELALMYNAPRAATVVSTESSMLWALDRVTFRRILMDSAFQRRRMYEEFLSEVPLLSSLMPYERSKIADALETVKFSTGSTIIAEGAPGEDFFLLENGTAEVYKKGDPTCLKTYSKGDYFGELALLNNAPRAASVVAKTDVKVARLGKDGFTRLLGNLEGIMRRADYSVKKADRSSDPLVK